MVRRPFGICAGGPALVVLGLTLSLSLLAIPAATAGTRAAARSRDSGRLLARVLVMGRDGRVAVRSDPFLGTAQPLPRLSELTVRGPRAVAAVKGARAHRPAPPSVPAVLGQLARRGQLTTAQRDAYLALWRSAARVARRLHGTPAVELRAVIANVAGFAAAGRLDASRLPEVFLTLQRNRDWWVSGAVPADGQRVEFTGSGTVWEYYPGQGLELQVLGTFGRADGLYTAGPGEYGQLLSLIDEMLPLAAVRDGALTWEYLFDFDGGAPPWTSAMAQGTALEALARAAAAARSQGQTAKASAYLAVAHQALRLLELPPPAGVAEPARRGTRFLQYSFAPQTDIINAFLQTLIGLYDYAKASQDPAGSALFQAGSAQAQAELGAFDTGAWSLYQPGQEDSLDYHVLVTGFLHQLCQRTSAAAYCTTAQRFDRYLKTPPALSLLTTRVRSGVPAQLAFRLSKVSNVGVVILRGNRTVFLTSAPFSHGSGVLAIPALKPAGSYTVHLTAKDLAGNFTRIEGSLDAVAPPPPRRHRRGKSRSPTGASPSSSGGTSSPSAPSA